MNALIHSFEILNSIYRIQYVPENYMIVSIFLISDFKKANRRCQQVCIRSFYSYWNVGF